MGNHLELQPSDHDVLDWNHARGDIKPMKVIALPCTEPFIITAHHLNMTYCIRSNYRTYPYKRTVEKFRSLQITASVLFLYFFIKAYVVGNHLNCIDLSMQFK